MLAGAHLEPGELSRADRAAVLQDDMHRRKKSVARIADTTVPYDARGCVWGVDKTFCWSPLPAPEADDKRADLNLQISLLSEHETTQLLTIVAAIAEKIGVDLEQKAEIEELQEDVTPEEVVDTMEKFSKDEAVDLRN